MTFNVDCVITHGGTIVDFVVPHVILCTLVHTYLD